MDNLGQIQARITAARDREHAWAIINAAPTELRKRLVSHAQTVFSIRRYHENRENRK